MRHRCCATVAALLVLALLLPQAVAASTVTGRVSPSTGDVTSEFVFVMKYRGDVGLAAAFVNINGSNHTMAETDPSVHNASDGKEYFFRTNLKSGANIYYFVAVDMNGTAHKTDVAVVSVDGLLNFRHSDVAFAILIFMAVFMLPSLLLIHYLKKISKALAKLSEEQGPGKGET